MKLTDLQASYEKISILLKGPWGFGKTVAAASFAVEGPIFIAYWDKKAPVELVQFFKKHRPELLQNIEYEVYSANNANEYLNTLMQQSKDCRYVAIINDSVTNMTSAGVNWSLGFGGSKKDKAKISIPSWDEYKVETSLVTQALDICRTIPAHVIWTCHPVASVKVEGAGASIKVSKVNKIVTYGSKVGDIVPGNFSEIYHFSKASTWDPTRGKSDIKYIVSTDQVGDDFAKSNIGLNIELDITNRLFYEVWKEAIKRKEAEDDKLVAEKTASASNLAFGNADPSQSQTRWKT